MDPALYKAARSGDVAFLLSRRDDEQLLSQKTPKGSSILHIAAEFNQLEFFKQAADICPSSLLKHVNIIGDTALHFAARKGSAEVVSFIISRSIQAVEGHKELLRMVNREGDNALHLAAQYVNYQVAELLVNTDPELSKYVNKACQSACFMATVRNDTEIVELLLGLNPPCSLRGDATGMTALHAALLYHKSPYDIMKKIVNARAEMIREGDAIGWTPLHYAACDGRVDVVEFLLKHDSSAAYLVGKEGESALHIAAFNGHVNVMEVLVNTHPDCWDLVDNKGRTALHAAVLGDQLFFFCFCMSHSECISILRIADEEGNTPLHLAALSRSNAIILAIFNRTTMHEKSLLSKATNKQNLTALDIYENGVEGFLLKGLREGLHVTVGLQQRHERAMNLVHKITEDEHRLRQLSSTTLITTPKGSDHGKEDQGYNPELLKVTATLIASVTFAAAFTMPGGYNQSGDPNPGMAVLASKPAFQAFLIFDLLSFFSAITVVFLQFTGFANKDTRKKMPRRTANLIQTASTYFMVIAFVAMALAFTCGVYVVLAKSAGLALSALIMSTSIISVFVFYFSNMLVLYFVLG